MERLQIVELASGDNNAGTKATADIAAIADMLGFKRVTVHMNTFRDSALGKLQRQIGYYRDWKQAYDAIPARSAVLMQHPFHHNQLTRSAVLNRLKSEKNVRFISVVHDVEELRVSRFNDYYAREFSEMLKLADVLIVHNPVMRGWFIQKGVPAEKLVCLGIFDYLQNGRHEKPLPTYERTITIAGNLDPYKSAYISHLWEIKDVRFHLYGSNYEKTQHDSASIEYHGSLPPDALSEKLNSGFGLVWDGSGLDGCKGPMGQYLKYNNPHKLSLYLSSGLPVIIWKEAAEAELVKTAGVGICTDNLKTLGEALKNVTAAEYQQMAENAARLGEKLRSGEYGRTAISRAMQILEERAR